MPYSDPRRRNSINPRQILGQISGGVSVSSVLGGGGGGGATLQADYELTTPYTTNVLARDWGFVGLETDTVNESNPQVSSQTPFTFTATSEGERRIKARCTIRPQSGLERYSLALQHGANGAVSDATFTFHRVKRNPAGDYEIFLVGVVSLNINDILTLEVRSYNTSDATKFLGVQDARIFVYSV
jgi:hypothetical protein